jgi:hypothetical protein
MPKWRKRLSEVMLWQIVWAMLMDKYCGHNGCGSSEVAETNLLEGTKLSSHRAKWTSVYTCPLTFQRGTYHQRGFSKLRTLL